MYHYGDRFNVFSQNKFADGDKLVLVQVGRLEVCLISLRFGNRLNDPIVVDDPAYITDEEFEDMLGEYCNYCKVDQLIRTTSGAELHAENIERWSYLV